MSKASWYAALAAVGGLLPITAGSCGTGSKAGEAMLSGSGPSAVLPQAVREITYRAAEEGPMRRALVYTPDSVQPTALLVALHDWSPGQPISASTAAYARWAVERGWSLLVPEASLYSWPGGLEPRAMKLDVLAAIDHVRRDTAIDTDRIHLLGAGQAGYGGLLLTVRAYRLWAGAWLWSPIVDLVSWYEQVRGHDEGQAKAVIAACGGDPKNDAAAREACDELSALPELEKARATTIELNIQLSGDGGNERGSEQAALDQAIKAFNKLAVGSDQLDRSRVFAEIRAGLESRRIGPGNAARFQSSGVALNVFAAGAEDVVTRVGLPWLGEQLLGDPDAMATLPAALTMANGERVKSPEMWLEKRRPELLELFETQVYGRTPRVALQPRIERDEPAPALGGLGIRQQVTLRFAKSGHEIALALLIFRPAAATGPVPAFLGLNYRGNHSIHPDPAVAITPSWMPKDEKSGVVDHRATEKGRGVRAWRWPVESIVARGYALVTLYAGDIDPDYDDGFGNGVHPLFYRPGQTRPEPHEWGTIGAWAWGLSRAMDYLESDPSIDHRRVALFGHSRLGKTALWAGAQDRRFVVVIGNNTGCGGAALSRRRAGETVEVINRKFGHWFNDNFVAYSDAETKLPVDQHMLIALMAPRPVYITSASRDAGADQRGEFLAGVHATPVYQLFGLPGLSGGDQLPLLDQPRSDGTIWYHIRAGKHDIRDYDWQRFLDFADHYLQPRPGPDPGP